jgi:hypothetical protein
LIFENAEAFARIASAIEISAAIEGGAGPVKLGLPAKLAGGRWVLSHPFADVDADWILAYADDPEISIEWETT